jgi:dsDNA-binding SOS-regulon protein
MKKKDVSLEDEKSKIELFLAENRKGLSTSLLTKT